MALTLGKDYALARKTTWWFSSGPGSGTAILTPSTLYIFPEKTLSGHTGTTRTNTLFTIGGRTPLQAIQELVSRPEVTLQQADAELQRWASEVQGPVRQDMAAVKRIRIFKGWLRRGVAFSEKESGYDVRPKSVRPAKDEIQSFIELLQGRPGVELK